MECGTPGIWVMYFIAMLGFTIPGQTISYDVPITVFSALVAVTVVSVGLLVVGFSRGGTGPLLIAGAVTGCGVASMHYIGMNAIRRCRAHGAHQRGMAGTGGMTGGQSAAAPARRTPGARHTAPPLRIFLLRSAGVGQLSTDRIHGAVAAGGWRWPCT
jgi:Bacterial signalling protein N terminal repeat